MGLKIHHLNCATMCPYSSRLVNGAGSFFAPGRMVCHCLLIESEDGLVLVDTGLGVMDVTTSKTLSAGFKIFARPKRDIEETAIRQIVKLGFKKEDVRHIILTHLDVDHAGGLPDFPEAQVHIFKPEHAAAMHPKTLKERHRYVQQHWAHQPKWNIHTLLGESWFGFDSVQALGKAESEILLVPLVGHTRGHCGVAVRTDAGWLLHSGDAYFFHGEMKASPYCPPGLALFQKLVETEHEPRMQNQRRLNQLAQEKSA